MIIGTSGFSSRPCAFISLVSALLALSSLAESAPVTFTKDIAPTVFAQCMSCHRSGEVGPFPLTNYGEVKKKSKTILGVIDDGVMPPWRAESHDQFLNERKLTPEQKKLFHAWVEAGAPEGDPADLPPAPHFTEGWQLGEPDLVLEPEEAYSLSAEGRDVYRCFVLPSQNTEDRYVRAVEVRPGNRSIVHHALLFIDTSGKARELDAADPGPGYTSFGGVGFFPRGGLGGWAPGMIPSPLPDGVGYLLPKNADIVLQVHYHKSGKPESDRTRVGLFFSKVPVDKRFRSFPVAYRGLRIPAGDANYQVHTTLRVPRDVTVLSITPHMHLVGREMTVIASLSDGRSEPLIHVPDWDFNWQTAYWFKKPVSLPQGTKLTLNARYDNSAGNPNNPNTPPREVVRGEQTNNEMCIAFIGFTIDAEHITKGIEVHTLLDSPTAARLGSFLAKFQSQDETDK